jgi:hypothetical protein
MMVDPVGKRPAYWQVCAKNPTLNSGPPFSPHEHIFPHDPFLAHPKFSHDPARRMIFGAALRLNPVQTQCAKGELQHGVGDFGCSPHQLVLG